MPASTGSAASVHRHHAKNFRHENGGRSGTGSAISIAPSAGGRASGSPKRTGPTTNAAAAPLRTVSTTNGAIL